MNGPVGFPEEHSVCMRTQQEAVQQARLISYRPACTVRIAGKAEHIGYVKKLRLTSKRSAFQDIGQAQGWLDPKQIEQPMRPDNSVTVTCFRLSEEEVAHVEAYGSLDGYHGDGNGSHGGGALPVQGDAARDAALE